MSDEYGNDFVVLTDEDGNDQEFEHIDTVELDGQVYMAFIPADLAAEDEAEVVILKVVTENGEEILASVEDEDEAERVYQIVIQHVEELYEAEEGEAAPETPVQ